MKPAPSTSNDNRTDADRRRDRMVYHGAEGLKVTGEATGPRIDLTAKPKSKAG
jgi:hypothetical protein